MNTCTSLAIITGTSSGIGAALADQLLRDGWYVTGIARRMVNKKSRNYQHICCDLADITTMTTSLEPRLRATVAQQPWTTIVLVNNAGITGQLKSMDQLDADMLLKTFSVNTVAPIILMGLLARVCPRTATARIVNISTGLASRALPGCTHYCTSKAAMHMAGRVFAAEQDLEKHSNIGVLDYAPGIVDTEMQQNLRHKDNNDFPSMHVFEQFNEQGMLVSPTMVLTPILDFLKKTQVASFSTAHYEN